MSGLFALMRPAARGIATASVWKSSVKALRPTLGMSAIRMYGAAHGLTKQDVEARVLEVIKGFDKVDESKVRFASRCNLPVTVLSTKRSKLRSISVIIASRQAYLFEETSGLHFVICFEVERLPADWIMNPNNHHAIFRISAWYSTVVCLC